jgi:co-chaperonin GroES (HSP10)
MKIRALKNKVLVTDLERGARIVNGIIIPNDDGKSEGIRPRWAKVYSVGSGVTEVKVGQWILIEHGRWTRMIEVSQHNGQKIHVWGVEWPDSVLLVSDEEPKTEIYSKWA